MMPQELDVLEWGKICKSREKLRSYLQLAFPFKIAYPYAVILFFLKTSQSFIMPL